MKPRIAHFTFNLRSYSGAAIQALALARRVPGYQAVIFNTEADQQRIEFERDQSGVELVHLPRKPSSSVPAALFHAVRMRVGLVHLHGAVPVGLIVAHVLRKPSILKTTLLGDDDLDSMPTLRYGRLLYFLAKRSSLNIALSTAIRDINARHIPRDRILRLANGVELDAEAHGKLDPLFCTVGAITPRKRTHVAIDRFVAGYAHIPGARLFVVGPNEHELQLSDTQPGYLEFCTARIPAELRHTVTFTGTLPRQEVQAIYRKCIGFLLFSEHEGMPNALLESMGANCVPLIGTLGGVGEEIVPDDDTGYILADDAPTPELEAIRQHSARRSARARIEAAFDLDSIATHYAQIYDSLLGAPRPTG